MLNSQHISVVVDLSRRDVVGHTSSKILIGELTLGHICGVGTGVAIHRTGVSLFALETA